MLHQKRIVSMFTERISILSPTRDKKKLQVLMAQTVVPKRHLDEIKLTSASDSISNKQDATEPTT
jgi:hypothetical protein